MKLRIQPLVPALEDDVRDIYRECHPGWSLPNKYWFWANPTLLAIDDQTHQVVGYTSYVVNQTDKGLLTLLLQDTCVIPEFRRMGVARLLMDKRLSIGEAMGCICAVGMTQPDNKPMQAMLEAMGFKHFTTVPKAYQQARPKVDGLMYSLTLKGR